MDRVLEAKEKALKNIRIADHMLTQTYPLVNDPKLLLSILENVFLSLTNAMAALLHHERMQKKIPPFQENFESKFHMLQSMVASKHRIRGYTISPEQLRFIQEIKDAVIAHRKSPMEFVRKDSFIICTDDNYGMKMLSVEAMKQYISKAKQFILEVNKVLEEGLQQEVR
ncbi:hypothetical protein HYS48_04410 [Candidatus Woesearchaeota archaeon]|nr:hypothetical protein [Candidatus Woesearchaeota archaeon]